MTTMALWGQPPPVKHPPQDERLSAILRWISTVSSTASVAILLAVTGVIINLRDQTRDLSNAIRRLEQSDRSQDQRFETNDIKLDRIIEKMLKHGLEIDAVQRELEKIKK
jgi:hypothetical protein